MQSPTTSELHLGQTEADGRGISSCHRPINSCSVSNAASRALSKQSGKRELAVHVSLEPASVREQCKKRKSSGEKRAANLAILNWNYWIS